MTSSGGVILETPFMVMRKGGFSAGLHSEFRLILQIADIIDADDVVACIANWFIASDVRLAQDVGLSEVAFALRDSRDGLSLWV